METASGDRAQPAPLLPERLRPTSRRRSLGYWERIALWQMYVVLSGAAVYSYRHLPPGRSRLLLALPVVALNALVPLLFDGRQDLVTNLCSFLVTTALSSFKVLAWALDRGALVHQLKRGDGRDHDTGSTTSPAAMQRPLTFAQFLAVLALPITPAEVGTRAQTLKTLNPLQAQDASSDDVTQHMGRRRGGGRLTESRSAGGLARGVLGKSLALAAIVAVLAKFTLPRYPRVVVQGLALYCSLSLGMDVAGVVVSWLLDMPVAPHFDNPYAATSAADFWNKRWNLTVSNVMRSLIYDPIMDGCWVRRPREFTAFSRRRRAAGVVAVFAASGVMHELMYWYATGHFTRRLAWLSYFCLWGVVLLLERSVHKALTRRGVAVPTWVKRIYILLLFIVLVERMWWGPAEEARLPQIATDHALEAWCAAWALARGAAKLWTLQAAA